MRVITEEDIVRIQNLLDERLDIVESFENNADKVFYNGMQFALLVLGFDTKITDHKHTVLGNYE